MSECEQCKYLRDPSYWKNKYASQVARTDQVQEELTDLRKQRDELVELLKTSVAEFDDGIKYPLEVVNDLKKALRPA